MSGGVGPEREARLAEIQRRAEIGVITISEYIAWLLAELEAAERREQAAVDAIEAFKEQADIQEVRAEAAEKALRDVIKSRPSGKPVPDWAVVSWRRAAALLAGSAARTESEPA